MRNRVVELIVGLFLITAILVLVFLAFNTANRNSSYGRGQHYQVKASFDDVGTLHKYAPVRIGGVTIGQVASITLNATTYQADIELSIEGVKLPVDSEASITTEGLLGAKYISITPGYSEEMMKNKALIARTHSALILEKLIGELLFRFKDK